MTPQDRNAIQQWAKDHPNHHQIILVADNDEKGHIFSEFCRELTEISSHISFKRRRPDIAGEMPVIVIGEHIRFQVVPSGAELKPFLMALTKNGEVGTELPSDTVAALSALSLPIRCEVFISPHCPFCPDIVCRMIGLAKMTPAMRLSVIDAALFSGVAEKNGIKSVPTVILDSRLRWSGGVNISEFADVILNQDPSQLSALSIRGVVEDGKSFEIVKWMIAEGKIFPGLFELLKDEKWPIRLGAMVTFETLAEEHPALSKTAVNPLLDLLPTTTAVAQGDILYLLGVIGDKRVIPFLRPYQAPPHSEDIIEAANEAIASIAQQTEGG
jgi:hypothetical protein